MGTAAVKILMVVLQSTATRKVLMNLTLEMARWAASKTDNDVDDRLVAELAKALDSKHGSYRGNLYSKVKAGR